jgi:hypothetical protein
MTLKVFAIDTMPGIQRDGTVFDMNFYTDGLWVRFQRGRPRKIGGYRAIVTDAHGYSRGIFVNSANAINQVFNGYNNGLEVININNSGVGAGVNQFTLSNFTASDNNLWQFDALFDANGTGTANLLAHPGLNLSSIDQTTNTPVLSGDISGTTMSAIGVFSIAGVTKTSGAGFITLPAADARVGAGQLVTGSGIPANTTVVSVSTTTVYISNNTTNATTATITFDNQISVSGGVVVLYPYVFVYGNNGLIKNCAAGNTTNWVSADSNANNVSSTKIVKGLPVRGGSNAPSGLFWALDSLIRVSYTPTTVTVGTTSSTFYWRYDIISSQTSILSSQSVIEYDGIYYWCGVDRFLMYNGVVKEIKNNFNQNYFFDNLNYAQRQKVWAQKVPRFGEIWWFFPSGNSTECNDAVIYNIREDCWYDAGGAVGARRTAGYFSQVFKYPINAGEDLTVQATLFTANIATTNTSATMTMSINNQIAVGQLIVASGVTTGTYVSAVTANSASTTATGTSGASTITVTSATGILRGQLVTGTGIGVGATVVSIVGTTITLSVVNAGNVSGTIGFSGLTVTMSAVATATAIVSANFQSTPNRITLWQHEIGTDEVLGSQTDAIESSFQTSDLGWVQGGPSQASLAGDNVWLRLERMEPDFIQSGEMTFQVTGRTFAQAEDVTSAPYAFSPTTGKIDLREQRRELRLIFTSNVQGGDYQLGKVLLHAAIGDVRP